MSLEPNTVTLPEMQVVALAPRSERSRSLHRLARIAKRNPVGALSAVLIACAIAVAVLANVISPYDPNQHNTGRPLSPPSRSHLAGTDQFGRDVLSRVFHGARTSLYVGFVAAAIATVGATVLGVTAAYAGRWVDYVIQRFVDTVQSLPSLVLLIAILIVLGPGITNIVIALSLRQAFTSSRIVRSTVLSVQSNAYAESARALGCHPLRVMARHILPNIVPVLLILLSLDVGVNILAEASLSFLGYGLKPPTASWGGMMSVEGRAYMILAPWILIAPAIALSLVVFAVNMFGDTLRDILDPRLRT